MQEWDRRLVCQKMGEEENEEEEEQEQENEGEGDARGWTRDTRDKPHFTGVFLKATRDRPYDKVRVTL